MIAKFFSENNIIACSRQIRIKPAAIIVSTAASTKFKMRPIFFLRRSKFLTRPAKIATIEKIINACAANVTPRKIIVKLAPSLLRSTNCGRTAKKNNNTFGLSTFIKTPRLYSAAEGICVPECDKEIFLFARADLNAPNAKNNR